MRVPAIPLLERRLRIIMSSHKQVTKTSIGSSDREIRDVTLAIQLLMISRPILQTDSDGKPLDYF